MRPEGGGTIALALRLLGQSLEGRGLRVGVGGVLVALSSALLVLEPWPLKLIVDSVLGGRPLPPGLGWLVASSGEADLHAQLALLGWLCAGIVILRVLVGFLTMLQTNLLVSVGLQMVFRLRCRLFDHVQRLSLAFHDATPVGDSLHRVIWDSYAVQAIFNSGVVPAVTAVLTLGGILAVMGRGDPIITLIALAVSVPLGLLVRQLDRPMAAHALRVHERESDVSAQVQETLVGIRAVQAFGRETFEGTRFREHARASLVASARLTALQTGSQAVAGTLMAMGSAVVIFLAARRALAGQITAGDVVLTAAYVAMLYRPLETLTYTAGTIQAGAAGARRVLALLDTTPDVAEARGALTFPGRARGRVSFERVTFAYAPGRPVLRDVTLEVSPGETVGLVGPSGAGKTTLASLLPRFYDPSSGRVTLDGHNVKALTIASLRRQIALVLQEPVLFGATIRENIAYGRPGASDDDIRAAARAAGAHEFIAELPGGYATSLGERGVTLSGGQRQRLAIARAFLKDAPVLILDEPTSALDAETEAMLLETLRQLMRDRTALIITHRLSTVRHADRIVVLGGGRIVEMGTHSELLARDAVYARLHRLQFARAATVPDSLRVAGS